MQIMSVGSLQRGGRDHADQFAANDFNATPPAALGDGFENRMEGRDLEIDEVDRDLNLTARGKRETHRLDRAQASVRFADLSRYRPCHFRIGGAQVDVPGDEELARPHNADARGRMAALP